MKFARKLETVEAVQYKTPDDLDAVTKIVTEGTDTRMRFNTPQMFVQEANRGPILVNPGDWVIVTEGGDHFVASDEDFKNSYIKFDEAKGVLETTDFVEVWENKGKSKQHGWHWRRKAANGKVVSNNGEAYSSHQYALDSAAKYNPGLEVRDLSDN